MATIIECSFPIKEFALKETLDTHPEAHISKTMTSSATEIIIGTANGLRPS